MTDKTSIEEITGYLGVGALELLAVFFILDGTSGFLEFVETYAKTSSWAIFVTGPVLVISYVLGLISSLASESLLRLRPILTPRLFVEVTASGNESLIRRLSEVERHSRLLNGCIVAFVLLGIGSLAETKMMGRFGFVGIVGCIAAFALATGCPLIARHMQRKLLPYIHAVREIAKDI